MYLGSYFSTLCIIVAKSVVAYIAEPSLFSTITGGISFLSVSLLILTILAPWSTTTKFLLSSSFISFGM